MAISEKHEPLDVDKLPPNIKEELNKPHEVPVIEEYEVHRKILSAKKPNTGVEGDIPKKLVNEFSVEYSKPLAMIMNRITKSGTYPRQWVKEYQTALVKQYPPESENSLRLISCTAFFSKVYEAFIRDWIILPSPPPRFHSQTA